MNDQNKIHVLSRAAIIHQDKILLCKTVDIDLNFYYMPGGHIENGESAEIALHRELQEETGFECKITKFLGCLEYSFNLGKNSICHNHEYNFVFAAESEHLTSDQKILSPEKHIELVWAPLTSLAKIDFRAEPLKELLPEWLAENNPNKFASEMI